MRRKNTEVSKSADSGYEEFLRSVKPVGLGLLESSCKLDRLAYARYMSQKNRAGRIISTEYKLVEADSGYFDATGKFSLVVAESQKANPVLVIEALYESHFHCKAPVRKELAERFVASELRLVMWPYFRELVFDLCGKMSIPPITIPLAASSD
jgi:hypothetical protein